eukprot:COSAG01_NODE_303_length_19167_cov_10.792454_28_plen_102_part_00
MRPGGSCRTVKSGARTSGWSIHYRLRGRGRPGGREGGGEGVHAEAGAGVVRWPWLCGGRLLAQAGLLGLLLAEGRVTHTFLQLTLSDFSTCVYTDLLDLYT